MKERRSLLQHTAKSFLTDEDKQLIDQGEKVMETKEQGGVKSEGKLELVDSKGDKPVKLTDMRGVEDPQLAKAYDISEKAVQEWQKQVEADKVKGLDINDIESVKAFELGFTPLGNEVVIKRLNEEHKIGSIIIPAGSDAAVIKGVVIETGMHDSYLQKGDVVMLKTGVRIMAVSITIKDIKFDILDGAYIYAVYKPKSEVIARVRSSKAAS